MATIYGFITKGTNVLASGTSTNEARPYIARYASGEFIGTFPTVQQAQRPIELSAGGRMLKWIDETRNGIEAYRGEEP